jgi:hypothetical protein
MPLSRTIFRRKADIQEAPYDGDLILLNPQNNHTVSLNPMAAALWEALAWPQTPRDLSDLVQEAAPTLSPEECVSRVDHLIASLLTHDLLDSID